MDVLLNIGARFERAQDHGGDGVVAYQNALKPAHSNELNATTPSDSKEKSFLGSLDAPSQPSVE